MTRPSQPFVVESDKHHTETFMALDHASSIAKSRSVFSSEKIYVRRTNVIQEVW